MFDLDHVTEAVSPEVRLCGRIVVERGSFFEHVPAGADFYPLNWILHDWLEEDCLRILRTCRAAMGAHVPLLIGERMLESDPAVWDPTSDLVSTPI